MSFFEIASTVVLVSLTGVMAPGPLFVANIKHGMKGGVKSGLYMAAGHTIVEFPLVIFLGIGTLSLRTISSFSGIIAGVGAASLFAFAALQISDILKNTKNSTPSQTYTSYELSHDTTKTKDIKAAISAGLLLSGLNPFFLSWWASVGLKLISDAVDFSGFYGIFLMFGFHIWLDYFWMSTVAYFSSKGKRFLNNKHHKIVIAILSGILIYFGVEFSFEALDQADIITSFQMIFL